jgi:hypothetical protein
LRPAHAPGAGLLPHVIVFGRAFSDTVIGGTPAATGGRPVAATSPWPVTDELALLLAALATVPDFRKREGHRHPLPGILGPVVLGLMANGRSLALAAGTRVTAGPWYGLS